LYNVSFKKLIVSNVLKKSIELFTKKHVQEVSCEEF